MDEGAGLISALEDADFVNDTSLLEPGMGFTAEIESMLLAEPARSK